MTMTRNVRRVLTSVVMGLLLGGALIWWNREPVPAPLGDADEADRVAPVAVPALNARGTEGLQTSPPLDTNATELPYELRGRVVSRATGEPIQGALLALTTSEADSRVLASQILSDGDGRFSMSIRDFPGSPKLFVRARGFLPHILNVAPDNEELQVRLDIGDDIEGEVVDGDGRPVPGVRVACHVPFNTYAWPNSVDTLLFDHQASGNWAYSGDDGSFSIVGLQERQDYVLQPFKSGFVSSNHPRAGAYAQAGDRVRLVIVRASELKLRIVDSESGALVATAQGLVKVGYGAQAYSYYGPREQMMLRPPPLERGELRVRVRRDPAGSEPRERVALTYHCWAMGYKLTSGKVVFDWSEAAVHDVRIERLAPREEEAVTFTAALGSGERYSGELDLHLKRFEDESGTNMPSSVKLTFVDGRAQQAVQLPVGDYWVVVRGSGSSGIWWQPAGNPYKFPVRISKGKGVESAIQLSGRRFSVEVVDASGRPRRGYALEVQYPDGTGGFLVPAWDVPRFSTSAQGDRLLEQEVWVRPLEGRTTIRAVLAGVGEGKVAFEASDKALPSLVRVHLSRAPVGGK